MFLKEKSILTSGLGRNRPIWLMFFSNWVEAPSSVHAKFVKQISSKTHDQWFIYPLKCRNRFCNRHGYVTAKVSPGKSTVFSLQRPFWKDDDDDDDEDDDDDDDEDDDDDDSDDDDDDSDDEE